MSSGPPRLGGSWKWEKAFGRETTAATRIVGSVNAEGPRIRQAERVGPEGRARAPADGGAAQVRRHDEAVGCRRAFRIKPTVDLTRRIARLSAASPPDEPVLYDPTLSPTNRLHRYDLDDLGAVDLRGLSLVESYNS